MAIVEVSERAKSDFDEIIARLESLAGNRVAVKFVVSLSRAIVGLADFPGQGAPRPRLGRDMRVLIVSPYLILYEYALGDDGVVVLRIVHGRRKITRRFLRED